MSKVNLWLDEKDVTTLLELLNQDPYKNLRATIEGQLNESPQFVEKAKEYQQVAALLSMDLDLLYEIAHEATNPDAKKLIGHIELLHSNKEKMISDKEVRQRRYYAAAMLFRLPPGSIKSDKIER